jgi:hypothetical protein
LSKRISPSCLGRAHVELLAREVVDFLFQPRHRLGEGARHARQRRAVDLDAGHLHVGEHGDERAFERLVDGGDPVLVELRLEGLPEAQRDLGILGAVFHRRLDGDAVEGDLRLAGPDQVLDRDALVGEVAFGQRVHAVAVEPRVHRVGHEHRVVDGGDADAVAGEDLRVVLHVLADLEDGVVLEKRFQQG